MRTTGAAPDQIERAARDIWEQNAEADDISWADAGNAERKSVRDDVGCYARFLVRPNECIVSRDDLRTVLDCLDMVGESGAVREFDAINLLRAVLEAEVTK